MVAIVSGNSLGLNNTSAGVLGQNGVIGQAATGTTKEKAVVDVANGNLVLQSEDDLLMGQGLDVASVRTYNSQGGSNEGNGPGWSIGMIKTVGSLSGMLDTAGSTIVRTEGDGSAVTYTWNATLNAYVGHEGSGADDTLVSQPDGTWTWTDGSSGKTEIYGANGYIVSAADRNGTNTLNYAYTNGLLSTITDASGDSVHYSYSNGNLSQISDVLANGTTSTRVYYTYDSQNRLSGVTTDLSPGDNSETDGNLYWTHYSYVGSSDQIHTVSQQDGSSLTFGYDAAGRVTSAVDALGNTTTYSYSGNQTSVTDPLGNVSIYSYDGSGRLLSASAPAIGGVAQTTSYTYDANGDVLTSTDARGNTTTYTYDGNGNRLSQVDALGDTTSWTYNSLNQVTSQTVYTVAATAGSPAVPAAGAETTYYVYGSDNRLAYTMDGAGLVTQYIYNDNAYSISNPATGNNNGIASGSGGGELVTTISYPAYSYLGGRHTSPANPPTLANLNAVVATFDPRLEQRTDYTYDVRGQLATRTTYTGINSQGVTSGANTTYYVYALNGQLLQTIDGDGNCTSATYDGLGRQIGVLDANRNSTVTSYSDNGLAGASAGSSITVTAANGLVTTNAYNAGGQLISVTQSGPGLSQSAIATYAYDADGNLLRETNPDGQSTYYLYDAAGRQIAAIDPLGNLTQTNYNADNQVGSVETYANPVNLSLLVNGSGLAANPSLATLIAGNSVASTTYHSYDAAGRLVYTIAPLNSDTTAGLGSLALLTEYFYDGAGNLIEEKTNTQTQAQFQQLGTVPDPNSITMGSADSLGFSRYTYYYYDADNRLIGKIDPAGSVTQTIRNPVGQAVQTIEYATLANVSTSRPVFSSVVAGLAASPNDIYQANYYNNAGQLAASVDGEGYVTTYSYDGAGNLAGKMRYAAPGTISGGGIAAGQAQNGLSFANLVITPTPGQDQATTYTYTALNQLATETDANGAVSTYGYDAAGNLISTTVGAGMVDSNARTDLKRYNALGQLTAELSGDGAALLATATTQAQIDAIWAQYATTYTNDSAGLRTSMTDADGNHTFYYYDADGRLLFTIDGAGDVSGQTWNGQGQVSSRTTYATPLAALTLATMNGGVLAHAPAGVQNALNSLASANDRSQTYSYDASGRLTQSVDALGFATTYLYDQIGQLSTKAAQTDAAGDALQETYSYNNDSLLTGATDADVRSGTDSVTAIATATTISSIYDAFGRVTQTKDANGNVKNYAYDRLGREISVSDPASATSETMTYDAFGRVIKQVDFAGNVTTTSYNTAAGSATITVQTASGATLTQHTVTENVFGQQISVVDGDNNTTHYNYDADGNLVSVTDALGTEVAHSYDAADNLLTTIDANGTVTAYAYDGANRVLSKTVDPSGLHLVTSYSYNTDGQVLTVTDPKGVVTQTVYDKKGEVSSVTIDPSGINLTTSYTYDGHGDVLTVTDPQGIVTQYQYDTFGRRVSQTVDPTGLHLQTIYSYDANGNVIDSTDPNGNISRAVYDADNRVIYTIDGAGDVTHTAFDADGHAIQSVRYANALSSAALSTLPPVGTAVTASTVAVLIAADATRDNVVNKVYDAAGRLAYTVDGLSAVTAYQYDGNGNVVQQTAYINPLPAGTALTLSALNAATAAMAYPGVDQSTLSVYDARNRLIDSVSGTGALTTYRYDGNGQVIQKTDYLHQLPLATLGSYPNVAAWVDATKQATPGADRVTSYVYDNAGRLIDSVDGTGALIAYQYDGSGNVIQKTGYANPLSLSALPANPGSSQLATWIHGVVANPAADRVTDYVYDNAGRLSATATAQHTDASGNLLWSVVKNSVDKDGNVVAQTAYANFLSSATRGNQSVAAWIGGAAANPALDQMRVMAYDKAGRLTASAVAQSQDANGNLQWAVTGNTVDADGNVVASTAYATLLSSATQGSASTAAWLNTVKADPAQDRTTLNSYDAAGRLTVSATVQNVSANGTPQWAFTAARYDGNGNVVAQTAYATPLSAPAPAAVPGQLTSAQVGSWFQSHTVSANAAADRTTQHVFDADNRMIYSIDALGYVTHNTYNGLGQLRFTTLYDHKVNLASLGVPTASALDSAGYAVTQGGLVANPAADRTTAYSYDLDGNLTASYDAATYAAIVGGANLGPTDLYTYDALGNKLSYTNALGQTWTYAYDACGRQIQETDPKVNVTTIGFDANGSPTGTAGQDQLQTLTSYDAFGNVKQITTQAAGNSSAARTTQYGYDLAGRQVKVTYPQVQVYDAAGDAANLLTEAQSGSLATSKNTVTPTATTTYDALGNAIVNQDVGGHYSYKIYNNVGKVAYAVDAGGYVTGYRYDAFGAVTALTRYNYAVSVPAQYQGNAEMTAAVLPTLFVNQTDHSLDRTITTVYDQMGRAVRVIQPQTTFYDNYLSLTGPMEPILASETTDTSYDAFGDALLTSTYAASYTAGADTAGNPIQVAQRLTAARQTYTYFDQDGRLSAKVTATSDIADGAAAQGYLTTYQYDAAGNMKQQYEYAGAVGGFGLQGTTAAPVGISENTDRVTAYTYDADNRKTSQTLTAGGTTGLSGTNGNSVTTSYAYDGLGNLVSTTDALGGIAYSYYDALGRVIATATTQDTGIPGTGTASGTPAILLTVFNLDIYGNVVQQVAYANGASAITAPTSVNAGSFTPAQASGNDRISYAQYDNAGHAVENVDAAGNASFTAYDVFGRAVKQWRNVTVAAYSTSGSTGSTVANGVVTGPTGTSFGPATPTLSVSTQTETAFTVTSYDAVGQVTSVTTAGSASTVAANGNLPTAVLDVQTNTWNAFGEQTGQSISSQNAAGQSTLVQSQFTDYDNAGNAWLTNANSDGVVTGMLHNAEGQVTETVVSNVTVPGSATTLSTFSSEVSLAGAVEFQDTGLLVTGTRYDLLGNAVDQIAPAEQLAVTAAPMTITSFTATANMPPVSTTLVQSQTVPNLTGDGKTLPPVTGNTLSGQNTVTLNVSPQLATLGSGDLLVQLDYQSPGVSKLIDATDGSSRSSLPAGSYSTVQELGADQLSSSGLLTVSWGDAFSTPPISSDTNPISRIQIWKKDLAGNWQQVVDTYPQGADAVATGNEAPGTFLTVAHLQNALAPVAFTCTPAGGTQTTYYLNYPGQQDSPQLINFDGTILFNTAGLPQSHYTYAVQYQDIGDAAMTPHDMTTHDSGSFTLSNVTAAPTAKAADMVGELFVALLGRAPLQSEFSTYTNEIVQGQSMATVAQAILGLPEAAADFSGNNGTPSGFVTAMLNNMLGASASSTQVYGQWQSQYTGMFNQLGGYTIANQATVAAALINTCANYNLPDAASNNAIQLFANKAAIAATYGSAGNAADASDVAAAAAVIANITGTGSANAAAAGAAATTSTLKTQDDTGAAGVAIAQAASPLQVAQTQLAQIYLAIFGRAPDLAGMNYFAQDLVGGATPGAIASGLLTSVEATTNPVNTSSSYHWNNLTASQFVTQVFGNVYGRAPTSSELTTYVSEYSANGAGQTLADIVNSLVNYGATIPVVNLDPATLARQALYNDIVSVGLTYAVDTNGVSAANGVKIVNDAFAAAAAPGGTAAAAAAAGEADVVADMNASLMAAAQAAAQAIDTATGAAVTQAADSSTVAQDGATVNADNAAETTAVANASSAANNLSGNAQNTLQILQLYTVILNRAPTLAEYTTAMETLAQNGDNVTALAASLLSTSTGLSNYPANATSSQLITTSYRLAFNRVPSAADISYWSGVLSGGTSWATVLTSIINSAASSTIEGNNDQLTLDNSVAASLSTLNAAVNAAASSAAAAVGSAPSSTSDTTIRTEAVELYRVLYNSTITPAAMETCITYLNTAGNTMAGLTDAMLNGTLSGLTAPSSYTGLSNSAFISQVYQMAFNRPPSSTESTNWSNTLATGSPAPSRGSVLAQILGASPGSNIQLLADQSVLQGKIASDFQALIANDNSLLSAETSAYNAAVSAANAAQATLNTDTSAATTAAAAPAVTPNSPQAGYILESTQLYIAILNRAVDQASFAYDISTFGNAGVTMTSMAIGMFGNGEALWSANYPASMTNDAFVNKLYSNVLGRAPDTAGYNTWTSALGGAAAVANATTRGTVVNNFIQSILSYTGIAAQPAADKAYFTQLVANNLSTMLTAQNQVVTADNTADQNALSTENADYSTLTSAKNKLNTDTTTLNNAKTALTNAQSTASSQSSYANSLQPASNTGSQVLSYASSYPTQANQMTLVYQSIVNRAVDQGGFNYFMPLMVNGSCTTTALFQNLLGTPEALSFYPSNQTNGAFLNELYSLGLGRAPDTAGYNYWVGVLGGASAVASLATKATVANGIIIGTYTGTYNTDVAHLQQVASTNMGTTKSVAQTAINNYNSAVATLNTDNSIVTNDQTTVNSDQTIVNNDQTTVNTDQTTYNNAVTTYNSDLSAYNAANTTDSQVSGGLTAANSDASLAKTASQDANKVATDQATVTADNTTVTADNGLLTTYQAVANDTSIATGNNLATYTSNKDTSNLDNALQSAGTSAQNATNLQQTALIDGQTAISAQNTLSTAQAALNTAQTIAGGANGKLVLQLAQLSVGLTGAPPSVANLNTWYGQLTAQGAVVNTVLANIANAIIGTATGSNGQLLYQGCMVNGAPAQTTAAYESFVSVMAPYATGVIPAPGSDGTLATNPWVQQLTASQNYGAAVVSILLTGSSALSSASTSAAVYYSNQVYNGITTLKSATAAALAGVGNATAQQVTTAVGTNVTAQNGLVNQYDASQAAALAGSQAAQAAQTATQLYVAILNRAPDAAGLLWTINALGSVTQQAMAAAIFSSHEVQGVYPPSMTVQNFVNSFYQNAFGRMPEPAESSAACAALGGAGLSLASVTFTTVGNWIASAVNGVISYAPGSSAGGSTDFNMLASQFLFNARVAQALTAVQSGVNTLKTTADDAAAGAAWVAGQNVKAYGGNNLQTVTKTNLVSTAASSVTDIQVSYDRWGNAIETKEVHSLYGQSGNGLGTVSNAGDTSYTAYNIYNQAIATYSANVANVANSDGTLGTVTTAAADPYDPHNTNGSLNTVVKATTSTAYDALGRVIATTDANGNINQTMYDGFGNVTRTIQADGGINNYTSDAFGERTSAETLSPTGVVNGVTQYHTDFYASYTYDLTGHQIESASGSVYLTSSAMTGSSPGSGNAVVCLNGIYSAQEITLYGYDQLGRKIATLTTDSTGSLATAAQSALQHDDVANLFAAVDTLAADPTGTDTAILPNAPITAAYTQYDLAGNVTDSVDGDGNQTHMAYDAVHRKVSEQDADGMGQSWSYGSGQNSTGQLQGWTQMDGVTLNYSYYADGQLREQKANRAGPNSSGPQDLLYTYNASELTGVSDLTSGAATSYNYDLDGNQIGVVSTQVVGGVTNVIQDDHESYDVLHRVTRIEDSRYNVHENYDANGNLIEESTTYTGDIAGGSITAANTTGQSPSSSFATGTPITVWNVNQYDAMNRATLVDGGRKLDPVSHQQSFVSGVLQGQVVAPADINSGNTQLTEWTQGHQITYDAAGHRLRDSYYSMDAGDDWEKWTIENYQYTVAGQLDQITRDGNVIDSLFYNGAGEVVASGAAAAETSDSGAAFSALQSYGISDTSQLQAYDAAGRVQEESILSVPSGGSSLTLNENIVMAYDGVGNQTAVLTAPNGNNANVMRTTWNAAASYQQAGVSSTTVNATNTNPNTTVFHYDDNGNIASTTETDYNGVTNGNPGYVTKTDFTSTIAGQVVLNHATGSAGNVTDTHTLIAADGTSLGSSGARANWAYMPGNTIGTDQAYTPLTSGVGAGSANNGNYILQAGDVDKNGVVNWNGIAAAVWGNASLGWAIQQANGDMVGAPNAVIVIPPKPSAVYNSASTFTPYSQAGAIGNTNPAMPIAPPPSSDSPCGGAAFIIEAIVAVVAVTLCQEYLLPEIDAALGTGTTFSATGSVAGAAVDGAVASVASQAAGMAMGVQGSIHWSQVAEGALGGAVGAGLADSTGLTDAIKSVTFNSPTALAATRAVIGNAITQGIAVQVGWQPHFQWSQVAAAGITAGVAKGLAGAENLTNPYANFGSDMEAGANQFIGAAVAKHITGGRENTAVLAVDAFGNALGGEIAASMDPDPLGTFIASNNDAWSRIPVTGVGNAMGNSLAGTPSQSREPWKEFDNLGSELSNGDRYAANAPTRNATDFAGADVQPMSTDGAMQNGKAIPQVVVVGHKMSLWEKLESYVDDAGNAVANLFASSSSSGSSSFSVSPEQVQAIVAAGQNLDAAGNDFHAGRLSVDRPPLNLDDWAPTPEKKTNLLEIAQENKRIVDGLLDANGWRSVYKATNNFLANSSLGGLGTTPLTSDERAAALNTAKSTLGFVGKETEPMLMFGLPELSIEGGTIAPNSVATADAGATSPFGRVMSSHDAVNPGPLDPGIAGTFAGGRYSVVELGQDTTLYRAGTADRPLGQFFDATPPDSVLQTRIDKAVLPVWPGGATSPIDTTFAVSIPKGTSVYVGEVGSQGSFYIGGTQQIVVVKPWAIEGVQIINSTPIK